MTPDRFKECLAALRMSPKRLAETLDFHPMIIDGWVENGPPEPIAKYVLDEMKRRGLDAFAI